MSNNDPLEKAYKTLRVIENLDKFGVELDYGTLDITYPDTSAVEELIKDYPDPAEVAKEIGVSGDYFDTEFNKVAIWLRGLLSCIETKGKCMIWKGRTIKDPLGSGKLVPVYPNLESTKYIDPRRWVFYVMYGKFPKTHYITSSCGSHRCCQPMHLEARFKRKVEGRLTLEGVTGLNNLARIMDPQEFRDLVSKIRDLGIPEKEMLSLPEYKNSASMLHWKLVIKSPTAGIVYMDEWDDEALFLPWKNHTSFIKNDMMRLLKRMIKKKGWNWPYKFTVHTISEEEDKAFQKRDDELREARKNTRQGCVVDGSNIDNRSKERGPWARGSFITTDPEAYRVTLCRILSNIAFRDRDYTIPPEGSSIADYLFEEDRTILPGGSES